MRLDVGLHRVDVCKIPQPGGCIVAISECRSARDLASSDKISGAVADEETLGGMCCRNLGERPTLELPAIERSSQKRQSIVL